MNITVYLGSNPGNDPKYLKYAEEIGRGIGSTGNTMVYGGANDGLMGRTADAVIASGGKVIGVIPEFFLKRGHTELAELHVVKTMSERKQKMMDLGDAFIALPGGPGTIEEISEIISAVRIGLIHKPCILFSPDGYYDELRDMYRKMVREGFLREDEFSRIQFAQTPAQALQMAGITL
jgi:uncharacterized protein (TIGR00730 family)